MKDIDPEVRSCINRLEHELWETRERYENLKEQLALVLYRRFSRSDQIGSEVSDRVQVIPEQICLERHIRPKRACRSCEGAGDEDPPAVRVKPAPPSMIPGSILTAGLLAFVIVNKFVDHLALYRQAKRFKRLGVHISRQDMSNWIVAAGKRIFPLIELMRERIRAGSLIQMDETTLQVLRQPERENTAKSDMWLTGGGQPQAPLYLYEYSPSRGAECARAMFENYEGYLQSDGYRVYEQLSGEFPGLCR